MYKGWATDPAQQAGDDLTWQRSRQTWAWKGDRTLVKIFSLGGPRWTSLCLRVKSSNCRRVASRSWDKSPCGLLWPSGEIAALCRAVSSSPSCGPHSLPLTLFRKWYNCSPIPCLGPLRFSTTPGRSGCSQKSPRKYWGAVVAPGSAKNSESPMYPKSRII